MAENLSEDHAETLAELDDLLRPDLRDRVAADVALTRPRVLPPTATVGDVRRLLGNQHVQFVPLVAGRELRGVVTHADLAGAVPDGIPAIRVASLEGRTVAADTPVRAAYRAMLADDVRRLAVVGADGGFVGLLCLQPSRSAFCRDRDVPDPDAGRCHTS